MTEVDVAPPTTIPLHGEELSVARRSVETGRVRVSIGTTEQEHLVDEAVTHERVEVERVAIGRIVDTAPPVREEGDTTVISVVEEIVVVERRLVLKEEIRVRRVLTSGRHRESVTLREQVATVREQAGDLERVAPDGAATPPVPPALTTTTIRDTDR